MKNYCRLLIAGACFITAVAVQAQPSIRGFNVYYGHLHNHSAVSDGVKTPAEAYDYARNVGKLDFFSLADHSNQMDNTEWATIKAAADQYNSPGVFTTFYGFEWTENVLGHVAVINSANYITTASPYNTFSGLCNWLNANECVAFFNHPGRNNSTGREFDHFAATPTDKIVGMELWNKTDRFGIYYYTDGYYPGDGNKSWFDEAILRGWKTGASGSEDNHSGTWGTATASKMAILATANTRTDLYNAMKARRFFTTYDLNLALSFQVNGSEMGSILTAGTYSMAIQASDANGEVFSMVELLKNGSVVQSWTPGSALVNITGELACANGEYFYIRVKQADGDEAISSPIWIGTVNQLPSCSLIAPQQNSSYPAPASIALQASASDADGSIAKVEYYSGSTRIGESLASPWAFSWEGVAAGTYSLSAKAIDNMGGMAVSASVNVVVTNPGDAVTISSRISSPMDDVEESATGNISANVNSTDIELVNDQLGTGAGNQLVGLRFGNLNIPQGAIITHAYLQFTCDEVGSSACNLLIEGEDADYSAAFTTASYNVSGRARTTARVQWNPAAWSAIGETGLAQQTPDLSSILQEIVSRPGYVSTGAVSLIITGTGTRTSESYEGSSAQAARLIVTYKLSAANELPVVSIANPVSGAVFTAPATIDMNASASDADGSIVRVDFYQGTTLLGSDNTSPYSFSWANVAAGTYDLTAVATDSRGETAVSSVVNVVVEAPLPTQVFSTRIASGADDAEETAKGVVVLNGDDIELCYDSKTTGSQTVGLRFTGVSIPRNAVIVKAWLQFTVDEKTTAGTTLTIFGENADQSMAFTTGARNVSSRSRTAAAVSWIPAGWTRVGQAEAPQQTPDLKEVVQEIVSRAGWMENNSLSFIITATGNGKRTAVSYETAALKAAALVVEYQVPQLLKMAKIGSKAPLQANEASALTGPGYTCYPNPFSDVLNVELKSADDDLISTVEVYSASGTLITRLKVSDIKAQVSLPGAGAGIYLVKITGKKNSYLQKVVKR